MALIDDAVAAELRKAFAGLDQPVRLVVFSQALADPSSEEVRRLVEELAGLDERLSVESLNFVLETDRASALGIERVPAVAVLGAEKDYGVRFYGIPSGYEFGTLVEAVLDVSRGTSGLAEGTRLALASLERDVRIRVFTTPTCPYCPRAVRLAYRFAIESDRVSADGIEVSSFPDLVRSYRVSSVPKTHVADGVEFVGAAPEATLLERVQEAARRGGGLVVQP